MNENEVYKQHQSLVLTIAYSYQQSFKSLNNNIIELEDIIQVGGIGLLNAIRTYNTTSNCKFGTYATACIINAIRSELSYYKASKNYDESTPHFSFQYIISTEESETELSEIIGNEDLQYLSVENKILINQIVEIAKNTLTKKEFELWYKNIQGITPTSLGNLEGLKRTTMATRLSKYKDKVMLATKSKLQLNSYDLIS